MKKVLFMFLLFIFCFKVNALEIDKVFIDSEIEVAGAIKIRTLIKINDFDDELNYKVFIKDNNLNKFDGSKENFKKSNIYNATGIDKVKVGYLNENYDFDDFYSAEEFDKNVTFIDTFKITDNNGNSSIVFENNIDNKNVIYYLEYVITNVAVEHNDSAEVYYTYFKDFGYDINEIKILTRLASTSKLFEVWSHGSKGWNVSKDVSAGFIILEKKEFKKDDFIDLRILFDKELFMININESKKTKTDAIDIIKKIENERMNNTNIEKILYNVLIVFSIVVVILIIIFVIYKQIYRKK